jgi:hypothetical protein
MSYHSGGGSGEVLLGRAKPKGLYLPVLREFLPDEAKALAPKGVNRIT